MRRAPGAGDRGRRCYQWAKDVSRGLRYRDIGHGPGAVIWWWDRGRLHERLSRGAMSDLHMHLMAMDPDSRWRGRYEPSSGRLSVEPPTGAFCSGALPSRRLLDRLMGRFAPAAILIDTKSGWMRRILWDV